jgi:hypothetical protein
MAAFNRPPAIPGVAKCAQPRGAVRGCFWLLCTLACGYGWTIRHLGEDVAAFGFMAGIPGDCTVIYPGGMEPDGTDAGLLGHTLARLARSSPMWRGPEHRAWL